MAETAGALLARTERELAGETIAAFAHEANNRLATLAESAGLIGDLLGAARRGGARGDALRESVNAAGGLETQVAQFAELNRRLANFAEALRGPGPTNAGSALEDLIALAGRQARRRGVLVTREIAGGLPPVPCEPAAFLALAHRLLRLGLEQCPAGGSLRVAAAAADGGVLVRLAVEKPPGRGLEADEETRCLAASLGAALGGGAGAGELTVRFTTRG